MLQVGRYTRDVTNLSGGGILKNRLKQRLLAKEAFLKDSKEVYWKNLNFAPNSVVLELV